MKARIRNDSLELTKVIWDLCLLVMLRYEMGYGQKRLKDFYEKLEKMQADFTQFACLGDKKSNEYSNMDSAIITMLCDLDGIDWKDILGIEKLIFNGKDLTEIVEQMKAHKDSGYNP